MALRTVGLSRGSGSNLSGGVVNPERSKRASAVWSKLRLIGFNGRMMQCVEGLVSDVDFDTCDICRERDIDRRRRDNDHVSGFPQRSQMSGRGRRSRRSRPDKF